MLGVQDGVIEKSGSWYSYNGERIGQGKENVRTYLQQHKDTAREIEDALRAKLLVAKKGEAAKGEAAEETPDTSAGEADERTVRVAGAPRWWRAGTSAVRNSQHDSSGAAIRSR